MPNLLREAQRRLADDRRAEMQQARDNGATLDEIGKMWGISRQRVWQVLNPDTPVPAQIRGISLRVRRRSLPVSVSK